MENITSRSSHCIATIAYFNFESLLPCDFLALWRLHLYGTMHACRYMERSWYFICGRPLSCDYAQCTCINRFHSFGAITVISLMQQRTRFRQPHLFALDRRHWLSDCSALTHTHTHSHARASYSIHVIPIVLDSDTFMNVIPFYCLSISLIKLLMPQIGVEHSVSI